MSSALQDLPEASNCTITRDESPNEQSSIVADATHDACVLAPSEMPDSISIAHLTATDLNPALNAAASAVSDGVGAADIDVDDEEADLLPSSTSASKPRAAVEAMTLPPGMATAGSTFSRRRHLCAAVAASAAILGLLGALSFTVQHPSPHSAAAAAFPGSSGPSSATGPHSRIASRLVNLSDVHASALPNALTFVTIGDWGRQGGNGQLAVAAVLGEWASLTPGIAPWVVSVGDQFYPEGVSSPEDPQFETSWRQIYTHPWFASVRWLMINGNHDYRGAYLPVNWDGDARWVMPARYYAQTWNLPPQPQSQLLLPAHSHRQRQAQAQAQHWSQRQAQDTAESHTAHLPSNTVASDRRLRRYLLAHDAPAPADAAESNTAAGGDPGSSRNADGDGLSASGSGSNGSGSNGSGGGPTYVAQSAAAPVSSAGRPSWAAAVDGAGGPAAELGAAAPSSLEQPQLQDQQQQEDRQPAAAALRDCVHAVFLDTIPLIAEYRRAPETPAMAANIRAAGEASEQVAWLRAQLAAGAGCKASLVFGHHPAYSSGDHGSNSEMVKLIGPLASQFKIDAYIAGHDHLLALLRADQTDYIISGAGSRLRAHTSPAREDQWHAVQNGFTVHSINGTHIRHTFASVNGTTLYAVTRPLARLA